MKEKMIGFGIKTAMVCGAIFVFMQFVGLLEGTSSLLQCVCIVPIVTLLCVQLARLERRMAHCVRKRRLVLRLAKAKPIPASVA